MLCLNQWKCDISVQGKTIYFLLLYIIGEGFYLCNGSIAAPGEDRCYKCPVGTYNKDPFNTAEVPDGFSDNVCASIDCKCHHGMLMIDCSCHHGIMFLDCSCHHGMLLIDCSHEGRKL